MGKVIITCAITVDGLIQDPEPAPAGWLLLSGDYEETAFRQMERAVGLLQGRKNYEGFAAVWPTMAGDGRWADLINPMPKYVASTTLTGPLEWNATLLEGDLVERVAQLKSELDGDLISSGAGTFARFLVEHGLVDEVQFAVHPTVQGPGQRPFHEGDPIDLDLLEARPFDSGVTLLRFRPRSSGPG